MYTITFIIAGRLYFSVHGRQYSLVPSSFLNSSPFPCVFKSQKRRGFTSSPSQPFIQHRRLLQNSHNVCAGMIPRVCTCKSAQKNRIVRIENGTFLPIWLVAFGAFLWQYITYWMQIADAQSDLFTVAFERSSNKYIPLSELNGSFVENRQAILASIGSIVDRRPFREFGGNSRISRVLRSPFSRLYFFHRVVIVSRIFHMPP